MTAAAQARPPVGSTKTLRRRRRGFVRRRRRSVSPALAGRPSANAATSNDCAGGDRRRRSASPRRAIAPSARQLEGDPLARTDGMDLGRRLPEELLVLLGRALEYGRRSV